MTTPCKKSLLKLALIAAAGLPMSASACGAEPFLGEVCTFAFTFCPRGYLPADGSLLPIASNTALFSLLGTTYGGDGRSTFALPDLRGRNPVGTGQGPGLANVFNGEEGGAEQVVLNIAQLPAHNHAASTNVQVTGTINAVNAAGNTSSPAGKVLAASSARDNIYSGNVAGASSPLAPEALTASATATTSIGIAGSNQPVPVRNPYVGMTYCIATSGIFPSRN
ncbi:tail fiber protein [Methylomonas sp. SURF-1]|uniref:Tail fiber protein n=1 Tax=Methylomonas aurea TaxID=2952224 RepID=A0ABT1UGD4_9GAMM|nr:tail fiber protein [Methylomonas sp. SURF-1]MCQ8181197.1 tail fiber protein [Methylomonas sp. SURF-1]